MEVTYRVPALISSGDFQMPSKSKPQDLSFQMPISDTDDH